MNNKELCIIGKYDREDGGYLGAFCMLMPEIPSGCENKYDFYREYIKNNLPIDQVIDEHGEDAVYAYFDDNYDIELDEDSYIPDLQEGDLNFIQVLGGLTVGFVMSYDGEEHHIEVELAYDFCPLVG